MEPLNEYQINQAIEAFQQRMTLKENEARERSRINYEAKRERESRAWEALRMQREDDDYWRDLAFRMHVERQGLL